MKAWGAFFQHTTCLRGVGRVGVSPGGEGGSPLRQQQHRNAQHRQGVVVSIPWAASCQRACCQGQKVYASWVRARGLRGEALQGPNSVTHLGSKGRAPEAMTTLAPCSSRAVGRCGGGRGVHVRRKGGRKGCSGAWVDAPATRQVAVGGWRRVGGSGKLPPAEHSVQRGGPLGCSHSVLLGWLAGWQARRGRAAGVWAAGGDGGTAPGARRPRAAPLPRPPGTSAR